MLRTKKKQLNLKPNRVLDKRSSRGMLYENEELRLRTIHINDEVDKSQNDIKKLRKENEYLKREIWSLRDECEKLEEVIKKVYSGDPPPEDQLPKYQPRVRKQSTFSSKWDPNNRRGSCMSFSQYSFYGDEDGVDDDESQSYDERGHLTRQNSTMSYDDSEIIDPDEVSQKPLIFVSEETSGTGQNSDSSPETPKLGHIPHFFHWQIHEPELEAVTEESENSTSPNPSIDRKQTAQNLNEPAPEILYIDSSRATSVSSEVPPPPDGTSEQTTCSFYNPTIEITPASASPTLTNTTTSTSNAKSPTPPPDPPTGWITTSVDLGCVTVLPPKFEAISELKISTPKSPESSAAIATDMNDRSRKISQESANSDQQESKHLTSSFSLNASDLAEGRRASEGKIQPKIPSAVKSLLKSGELAQKKIMFRSEPSLNSLHKFGTGDTRENNRRNSQFSESYGGGFNGFDSSVEMCGAALPDLDYGWNLVDKNLVVGYLDNCESLGAELSATEIIDELEAQFDPTLEKIAGVRMLTLPGFSQAKRVFISLRTSAGVKLLLDRGLTVHGERVRLVDASQFDASSSSSSAFVTLTGLPPSFPDSTVISVLNQYGQVVAPLERRAYKGVDIAERSARMHLVRPLPMSFVIGGYQVVTRLGDGAAAFQSAARVPLQGNIPNKHKPVTRSATVEYGSPPTPSTLSPLNVTGAAAARRKISVCSAMMEAGAHYNNNGAAITSPLKQPPAFVAGNLKKVPLQKPTKSSPGSFSPQQSGDQFMGIDTSGRAVMLARSLSNNNNNDPRRISNASTKSPMNGSQLSLVDQQPHAPGHAPVSRQQSKYFATAQRTMSHSNSSAGGGYLLEKKEPLPWCGCWGNGCI